jgi:uncharacterized membrane protein YiaA
VNMNTSTHSEYQNNAAQYKPSGAFVAVSWLALGIGAFAFIIGLFNSTLQFNEKGYYFTVLCYGLFSAVSVQKSVRDRLEDIPVSNLYYGLSWFSTLLAISLLVIGLWNATLADSEKGFYAVSFFLGLFGAIAVQKNVRDLISYELQVPKRPKPSQAKETSKPADMSNL